MVIQDVELKSPFGGCCVNRAPDQIQFLLSLDNATKLAIRVS